MSATHATDSTRPRGSEAVTGCHLGTFPKTMLGDGRPMRRIPAFSEAGPRELSRRWSNSGRFKTRTDKRPPRFRSYALRALAAVGTW